MRRNALRTAWFGSFAVLVVAAVAGQRRRAGCEDAVSEDGSG